MIRFEGKFNHSLLFILIKYFNLFLGFFRTSLVAIILTKNQMGNLAFIYLIIEYSSYLFNLGVPNAINLKISVLKSKKKINIHNNIVANYYTHFFYNLIFFSILFLAIIYFLPNFISKVSYEDIFKNISLIFLTIFLYAVKEFCIIHSRLWGFFKKIMFAEVCSSLIYLLGIFFFLKPNLESPIQLILLVSIISTLCFILIVRINISLNYFSSFSFKNSKPLFKIGIFLMFQNLLDFFFWGTDRFFITLFLEKNQLAEFHVVNLYARGLMMFFSSFIFLIYPSIITDLASSRNNDYTLERIEKYTTFTESILIFFLGFYISFVPVLINIILPEYHNIFYLFVIILIGIIIKSVSFFFSSFLIARGEQQKLILVSISFLLITVLFYFLFNSINLNTKEIFSLLSVFIFILFTIYLSIFSYKLLGANRKKIVILILNRYSRIVIFYFAILYFYLIDLQYLYVVLFSALIIVILYYTNIKNSLKVIMVNLFKKISLTRK